MIIFCDTKIVCHKNLVFSTIIYLQNPKRRKIEMTSTGIVTVWENVCYRNTAGKIVTEELTISKQTTSDVYCLPCHDVGEYFRMEPETFYDHLKRKHNSILSAAVSCNLCHQKFNNLNAVKKHISKHKELKFKDIPKYQRQAEADFNPKNILVFPINVQDINGPFRMLREAEAECPLIEGNENCFGCIRRSKKSIITKAHEQDPKADPPAKNDLSTQTCQLCPYSTNYGKPAKILIANPKYELVHSETDIRKPGKYC